MCELRLKIKAKVVAIWNRIKNEISVKLLIPNCDHFFLNRLIFQSQLGNYDLFYLPRRTIDSGVFESLTICAAHSSIP